MIESRHLLVRIGRDWKCRGMFRIEVGIGRRPGEVPPGEVSYRFWWEWAPRAPRLLRNSRGQVFGIEAFGRCRTWRRR